MEIERRVATQPPEFRSDGAEVIAGYAATFNALSEELWGFREQIAPGAFDDVLQDDVRALFNHDPNFVLGRTTSKTLVISVDQTGLRNEITPPDTQWARDLMTSMKRGDITQQSFAFTVKNDSWEWNKETDLVTRTILKLERLYDVSIVTYPAYPQTTAQVIQRAKELRSQHSAQARGVDEGRLAQARTAANTRRIEIAKRK